MKNLMKLSLMLLLVGGVTGLVFANQACKGDDYTIMISPRTLVLSSGCDTITIHSNIPYSAVLTDTVAVNGVPAGSTGVDDCGDLVVKIAVADLADILQPKQTVTLTLTGDLADGTSFAVDGTINVR